MISFADKLAAVQTERNTQIGLMLSPIINKMPITIQRYDDPFLPFGKAIINASQDLVCAYSFDFAAYLSFGAAGAVALERTIAYTGQTTITILHGLFASKQYHVLWDETAFNVDALTLASDQVIESYLTRRDRGIFIQQGSTQCNYYGVLSENTLLYPYQNTTLKIKLVGDDVIYAKRGDDFSEQIRAKLLEMMTIWHP